MSGEKNQEVFFSLVEGSVMFLDQFQGRYGDSWISFRVAAVTPGCSRELATGAWK